MDLVGARRAAAARGRACGRSPPRRRRGRRAASGAARPPAVGRRRRAGNVADPAASPARAQCRTAAARYPYPVRLHPSLQSRASARRVGRMGDDSLPELHRDGGGGDRFGLRLRARSRRARWIFSLRWRASAARPLRESGTLNVTVVAFASVLVDGAFRSLPLRLTRPAANVLTLTTSLWPTTLCETICTRAAGHGEPRLLRELRAALRGDRRRHRQRL